MMSDGESGEISTNRDFYVAVSALIAGRAASSARDLEQYLSALWGLCRPLALTAEVSAEVVLKLLGEAFETEVPPFDVGWARMFGIGSETLVGFRRWEAVILRQIVDLHEMRASGALDNEMKCYGICSPRGSRWFNFSPGGYLECGIAGALGGWEPGDATGRSLVPGKVAVMGPEGQLILMDAADVLRPQRALGSMSWELLADFAYCGQVYE